MCEGPEDNPFLDGACIAFVVCTFGGVLIGAIYFIIDAIFY